MTQFPERAIPPATEPRPPRRIPRYAPAPALLAAPRIFWRGGGVIILCMKETYLVDPPSRSLGLGGHYPGRSSALTHVSVCFSAARTSRPLTAVLAAMAQPPRVRALDPPTPLCFVALHTAHNLASALPHLHLSEAAPPPCRNAMWQVPALCGTGGSQHKRNEKLQPS